MIDLYPLRRSLLLTSCCISAAFSQAQYDTVFVGTPEAASVGPFETPFPTGGARTSRTQYLFPYTELNGVLPSWTIEGLMLSVLSSDPPGTTVDLELRMKNTMFQNMAELDYNGLTLVADTFDLHIQAGALTVFFDHVPFQVAGSPNLLIEFGMQRTGPPGIDPSVKLDTSFVIDPTYYVQDSGLVPIAGLYSSNALYAGPFDSRPVMGFLFPSALTMDEQMGSRGPVAVFPNPASDHLCVRLVQPVEQVNLQLFSATGSMVRSMTLPGADAHGMLNIPLTGLPAGAYLLRINDDALLPIWQQRIVVR
jgi:hypothetical protein